MRRGPPQSTGATLEPRPGGRLRDVEGLERLADGAWVVAATLHKLDEGVDLGDVGRCEALPEVRPGTPPGKLDTGLGRQDRRPVVQADRPRGAGAGHVHANVIACAVVAGALAGREGPVIEGQQDHGLVDIARVAEEGARPG